jgi:hypothetical protein
MSFIQKSWDSLRGKTAQKRAIKTAEKAYLDDFYFTNPFARGGFAAEDGTGGYTLGQGLDPLAQMYMLDAQQNLGASMGGQQGSLAGLPEYLRQAALGTAGDLQNPNLPVGALGQLQYGLMPQDPNLNVGGNPFDRALEAALRGNAMDQMGTLNMSPEQLGQQRLDVLRQQAEPFEQRQFNQLQDNLFATGRVGTTGGGIQTEAFARGLAQADTGRQLAAQDLGRQYRADALGQMGSMLGMRGDTRRLEDALNQNLFGRQLGAAGFGLDRSRFGLDMDRTGEMFRQGHFDRAAHSADAVGNRALQRFGLAEQLFGHSLGLGDRAYTRAGGSLGALGQISGFGQNAFENALNAAIARSNAAAGVGSNVIGASGLNKTADLLGGAMSMFSFGGG